MKPEVFSAGTMPGSPSTMNEIKTLLCFLLAQAPDGLTFEKLHEVLQEARLVNYFDLIQNLEQLTASGHVLLSREDGIERFTASELGSKTAKELASSLPRSVRDRALETMKNAAARQKRLEEIPISIEETPDGCRVRIAIPDPGTDLLDLAVFVPTRAEAETIRVRFLNDPIFLYKGILALLQGNKEHWGDLLPGEEKLF